MAATRKQRRATKQSVSVEDAKRIATEALRKEQADRVEAFKADLAALCEKHGMAIHAIPTVVPARP